MDREGRAVTASCTLKSASRRLPVSQAWRQGHRVQLLPHPPFIALKVHKNGFFYFKKISPPVPVGTAGTQFSPLIKLNSFKFSIYKSKMRKIFARSNSSKFRKKISQNGAKNEMIDFNVFKIQFLKTKQN